MNSGIAISGLYIYPIKSMRGISLKRSEVTPFGLKYDRRYMLSTPDGTFITQRTHPALATFHVSMSADFIEVRHPETGMLRLPLQGPQEANMKAVIWKDEVDAFTGFKQADEYFSNALDDEVQITWMPDSSLRQTDLTFSKPGDRVSFADGFPILLIGQSSIDELNERLEEPLPMNRFRPNVVVSGASPWEEDSWKRVTLPDSTLDVVKGCGRCIVTTTNQETGERAKEPLITLATYRKWDSKIWVGVNCIPHHGIAPEIRVGESLDVTR